MNALAPVWIDTILRARPVEEGPSLVALAQMIRDDEEAPVALRAIAAGYCRTQIKDRPRARMTDPETSRTAEARVTVQRRPGGTFHRLLRAYEDNRLACILNRTPAGLTSREVEEGWEIREAHKRTSDLLRDGLLEVVLDDDGDDLVRDGGRVLSITDAGRDELTRMEAAARRSE